MKYESSNFFLLVSRRISPRAAYDLMKDAYMKASGDGALPAKARQVIYAARGDILRLTSNKK